MRAADYWDQALTYDAYLAQMRENRELFERRLPVTDVTDAERSAFGGAPLRVLILTEDYCGDSAQFIPAVGKLAQTLANVEVRLLLRNEHRELAQQYLRKDGYQAIPVFIVLEADGRELGYLIERPQRAYDELAAETHRFAQAHPELEGANRAYANMPADTKAAVFAHANHYRDGQQAEWTRFLFDELAQFVAYGRGHEAQVAD